MDSIVESERPMSRGVAGILHRGFLLCASLSLEMKAVLFHKIILLLNKVI